MHLWGEISLYASQAVLPDEISFLKYINKYYVRQTIRLVTLHLDRHRVVMFVWFRRRFHLNSVHINRSRIHSQNRGTMKCLITQRRMLTSAVSLCVFKDLLLWHAESTFFGKIFFLDFSLDLSQLLVRLPRKLHMDT